MVYTQEPVPFQAILEHIAQEVIRADAEMQLLQRVGWQGLIQKWPLAKGLDDLERLSLTQVKLKFWMEPARLSWWLRLKRFLRGLFGKRDSVPERVYRLAPGEKSRKGAVEVTVTVSRNEEGKFIANSAVTDTPLEGSYVADFSTSRTL